MAKNEQWRPEGRPVRLALVTWPAILFLGATFAAAACLIGDCDRGVSTRATETRLGQAGTLQSLAYQSDGTVLSSVGLDGSIVVWGLNRPVSYPFLPDGPGKVRSSAFSPDNRVLAAGNLIEAVTLHDLVAGESFDLDDPDAATAGAACLAFAPDGATLAVGQQDGQITLWDAATGSKRSTLAGHTEFVASMVIAQDGTTLASSGGDHSVRIWDLPEGRERFLIRSASKTFAALSISPGGRLLALADQVTPVVWIWDLTTKAEHAVLRGSIGAVVKVAISPDGTTLAAADYKGYVTFWDLATLKTCPKRAQHGGVHSLAFAPDGHTLATGGFDGTVRFWAFPIESAN